MGLTETILFYLLFGAGIATAVALRRRRGMPAGRLFEIGTAFFFWPLYLPILLARPAPAFSEQPPTERPPAGAPDELAAAISQVEAELETALDSLDGWAENVLAREHDRFAELRAAWRSQAERIGQLDRLLAAASASADAGTGDAARDEKAGGNLRIQRSEQARRENFERLHTVRARLHDDLMGTLAWVRELVSMIHLAKFTGAPASRAEELVSQIATAVEGLSKVAEWNEPEYASRSA